VIFSNFFVESQSFGSRQRNSLPSVGVLYPTTSIGGTRRRVDSGHRQTWNSKVCARIQETRFIQVQVARIVYYVLFGVVLCPALGCCSPEGLWIFS
jgi:hypothetical protein